MREERTSQDHCTPPEVVDIIQAFAPIQLDPCWNEWAHTAPYLAYDIAKGDDGLGKLWWDDEWSYVGQVFVNPPYRKIGPWVEKAASESRIYRRMQITMLVPVSPETKWSRAARRSIDAMCEWGRRIAFEGAGGNGAKQASQLLYWGPNRFLFCHHFERHGEVRAFDRRVM